MQFRIIKPGVEATTRYSIGNVAADAATHAPCTIVILDEVVPESLKEFPVHEGASWANIDERLRRHVEMIQQQLQSSEHSGEECLLRDVKTTSPRDSDR